MTNAISRKRRRIRHQAFATDEGLLDEHQRRLAGRRFEAGEVQSLSSLQLDRYRISAQVPTKAGGRC